MLDYLQYLPEVLTALMGGGWLVSRWRRRQERDNHAAQLAQKEAELTATLRDSETKYTREALEIYTEQVVKPIREELQRLNDKQVRYEDAINRAPLCRMYPDCVVVHKLRGQENDNNQG